MIKLSGNESNINNNMEIKANMIPKNTTECGESAQNYRNREMYLANAPIRFGGLLWTAQGISYCRDFILNL